MFVRLKFSFWRQDIALKVLKTYFCSGWQQKLQVWLAQLQTLQLPPANFAYDNMAHLKLISIIQRLDYLTN